MNRLHRLAGVACLLAELLGVLSPAGAAAAEPETGTASEAVADTASTRSWLEPGPPRHRWGLIASAVGVVGGVGLGLWVKSEADERFDRYLETADPETARELFESAERYDRAALIGFGLAQISFVAVVYFLSRENERPLVPVRGQPVLRLTEDGPQVGVRFTP